MKVRLVYAFFFAALCVVVLQSNRNGRATVGLEGVTGAPGDVFQGGNAKTCGVNGCHNNGAFAPVTVTVSLLESDTSTTSLTQYIPGKQYIARVRVTTGSGAPKGYGFQMIAIRNRDSIPANGFTDASTTNNYRLKTLTGNRMYAEHPTMSTTNTFDVLWKGPAAGSGSITFYAAGNAVNDNTSNTGDGATTTKFTVTEGTISGTNDLNQEVSGMRISPNPVLATGQLMFDLSTNGARRILVYDLAGRIVWENNSWLPAGFNTIDLPAEDWKPGIYMVQIAHGNGSSSAVKMVKM